MKIDILFSDSLYFFDYICFDNIQLLEELRAKNLAVDEADMRNFIRNVLEIKDGKSIAET